MEQRRAHHLVDGVVAPHVFPRDQQLPAPVEEPRGVQPSGPREAVLRFLQPRQRQQYFQLREQSDLLELVDPGAPARANVLSNCSWRCASRGPKTT